MSVSIICSKIIALKNFLKCLYLGVYDGHMYNAFLTVGEDQNI